MSDATVGGLHHVTAICAAPRENLEFYTDVLGLRLVKRSVNQDAPDTYHLFYADGGGTPGTDVTFFPWPHLAPGRDGVGMAVELALAVPAGSLPFWCERVGRAGIETDEPDFRRGRTSVGLADPHGLALTLVEIDEEREFVPWERGPVPVDRQVRGLHAVRARVRRLDPTETFLEVLGFAQLGEEDGWHRFSSPPGGTGTYVDVHEDPEGRRGTWGPGGIHHVAFRVDDAEQRALRERLVEAGLRPTPVIDRFWFRSVYVQEPGGVLFELATGEPGFAVDEDPDRLGERLVLPPWLESRREEIEAELPPLP